VNALSGDTYLFAEIDRKYGVYTLRELYELHNQGHKIKVPTLLNERGEKGWIEVENVVSYGNQSLKRIILSSSRLYVEINEDAIIPAFSNRLFLGREKIILNFKRANELKVSQNTDYNDTLLLATGIPLFLPEGNNEEWDFGFSLGFVLAEASFIKRKRKYTKQSLATLNGFARKKGMTLEEYLNHTTDIQQVQLSVGQSDFERGYIQILQKHFKFSKPHKVKGENGYQLHSSDLNYIHLIKDYIDGSDSHTKHLKNEAFNRTKKFLEGIMDGFLCGDGSYYKNMDLFVVEITTNYRLYNDLIFLSKALGYDAHINNGEFVKSPSSNNYYYYFRLSIFKNWHRHTAFGLVKEHIKKIEDVGKKEAFNLVLKPLYPETDKRAKFNHLYFTAFGILVSDAVKTLERCVLSSSLPISVYSNGF
jgi:hypothetical protein